jgi:ribosomal protein S18 acetylase RimI-like enzyme
LPVVEIRASTPGDFEAVLELLTARSIAALGESELRRDQLAAEWALAQTDCFVATNGTLVGYASLGAAHDLVIAADDAYATDALLGATLRRARERGFDTLNAIVLPEDVPFLALVERAGFEHRSDVLRMWRHLDEDLREPSWPSGATVRGYADADAETVHALLDAAYAGWDESYVARPHDDWLQFMTDHDDFDPDLWLLVERDGELVACALNWNATARGGWVKDLVVRESERGQGLGQALLHHTFLEYRRRGAERVGLKVDADNPTGAPRLYERVGFVTDRRYGIWVKRL